MAVQHNTPMGRPWNGILMVPVSGPNLMDQVVSLMMMDQVPSRMQMVQQLQ
jgi:hypothetical protein